MPRQPRSILPPAAVYHVTSRGVARCAITVDDIDRRRWVSLLHAAVRAQRWQCLAWCLMPNHFQIVVDCELDPLSPGMHSLSSRYAQKLNARYGRVGHLFRDRFHTRVIRDDEHLGRACTYVLDHALRANLCTPEQPWRWRGGLYASPAVPRTA